MTDTFKTTTECEMIPGVTTTVVWKLKNWKEYSESLVKRASCLVQLEDSSKTQVRFTLKEISFTEKAFDRDEGREMTKTNVFYALNMEILDDFREEPVSFKVVAMDIDLSDKISTGDKTVTFNKDVNDLIVESYFIHVRRLVVGSRGLRTEVDAKTYDIILDKDTQELNIQISVTMLTLQQNDERNTSGLGDPALKAPIQRLDEFAIFLEDNQFCDVKLKMSDEILLPAHRIILATRSSVFKAMLTSDMMESKEQIIEIPDIGSEAMKIILKHIYTGKVEEFKINENTDGELMKQVVYGASKYNLPELLQHCDNMAIKVANFGNAWELLKLARMHNMPRAIGDLEEFVKKNCLEILQQTMGANQIQA